MHIKTLSAIVVVGLALALLPIAPRAGAQPAKDAYSAWSHSASLFILTTPDGADLSSSASEEAFPLLLRLHKDTFDFTQAKPNGEDLRFSSRDGAPLAHQIEEWNPAQAIASIWIRIPTIKGNTRQEIHMHWGNPAAASGSDARAVFNASNGFVSVWHMTAPVQDDAGTLVSKDTGTSAAPGMIGPARHFPGGKGIFGGDKIPNYPSGGAPHSSSAWFRAQRPNTTILGWGNEGGGRGSKVRMQLRSPPHIHIDSDFSDVNAQSTLPMDLWIHVEHTYANGQGKIYINGQLDGSATPKLAIKSPSRLWLGGWYNNYDFVGDLDEVRISSVARSADWVKLEYENQKPQQTLIGPPMQAGDALSVTPARVTLNEGQHASFTATAGGAQQIYWILKRSGRETVISTNRFTCDFDAGRISADESATLQFKAIYASSSKTIDIPITIKHTIPQPLFTLTAPTTWDGRTTIEVTPQITNLDQMRAASTGDLHYAWNVADIAVTKEESPNKLILRRAQNSGTITVTLALDNGGPPVTRSIQIKVTEPAHDAWLPFVPAADEKPVDNQFYPRDDQNQGTLYYNGTLDQPADSVFLRVYADQQLYKNETARLPADRKYAFAIKLKPGLIKYKVEFGTQIGQQEKILSTINNIICGDAYLIDGQSNAEATAWGNEAYTFSSTWIRSFGTPDGNPKMARTRLWADATARSEGGKAQIGYWGMELARRLLEEQKIPICFLNGAVGGTRIDQHQRNSANPEDATTIYGRLLWRVQQARLTHGIRAILWHQGENDQGADGPTGGFGYETYRQYFLEMAAGWKQDYPNVQHYYVFQIWPKSCAMGINGSDNKLREVQRTLPTAFSHLSVMSTLGIDPPGGCHYPPAGYAEFARLICPLIQRDLYGKTFADAITAPDLKRAYYSNEQKDEIVMEFDQPMKWDNTLASQFYLDGQSGRVAAGVLNGNKITLRLTAPSTATTITYLDSKSWSQKTLLKGQNNIAALTFCEVPLK